MDVELPSPCLVVLVGPAGSGKSTWAAQHLGEHVVSSDALRALVGEGESDVRASADAFALLDEVVERRSRRRLTTVIDSLGTDAARRARWRDLAARHGLPCVAVVFDVAPAVVRRLNAARAKRVPDAVLRAQLAGWPEVVAAVDAEPFDAVHRIGLDARAALVDPSLVRGGREVRRRRGTPGASTPGSPSSSPLASDHLTLGLHVSRFAWPGGAPELGVRLRDVGARAEAAGLTSLWVMDHLRQIPTIGPPWEDLPECWTTLAHLAAATSTIRLGSLVTAITHRSVPLLGKVVATLDALSGGRVTCGLGLGWFADEQRAYGWTLPPVGERYALLEDALQLLPLMWGPGGPPFTGRVLQVPDTSCYPRPVQAKVPILVGGSGERRTLRLVARYADACNLFGDPETVAGKARVLRQHCAAAGRDPAEISVTHLSTVLVGDDAAHVERLVAATRPPRTSAERHRRAVHAGTLDQHLARLARLRAAGVDHVIVSLADLPLDDGAVERAGVLAARAAELPQPRLDDLG